MKVTFPLALAAALVFGCSSSNKNTRTASNDTGTTQPGSIEGTQGTAGGTATASAGTAAQPNAPASNNPTGADTNAQGSMGTQGSSSTATAGNDTSSAGSSASGSSSGSMPGSTTAQAPSGSSTMPGDQTASSGQAVNPGTTSSTYGQTPQSGQTPPIASNPDTSAPGSSGSGAAASGAVTSGTASTSDTSSLRTVTGAVAKVDEGSITLDQAAGGVTLTVDSQTQILRRGQPLAAGISAIKEGQQVRASFDPASNRADKIEVMAKHMKHKRSTKGTTTAPPSNTPSDNGGK